MTDIQWIRHCSKSSYGLRVKSRFISRKNIPGLFENVYIYIYMNTRLYRDIVSVKRRHSVPYKDEIHSAHCHVCTISRFEYYYLTYGVQRYDKERERETFVTRVRRFRKLNRSISRDACA